MLKMKPLFAYHMKILAFERIQLPQFEFHYYHFKNNIIALSQISSINSMLRGTYVRMMFNIFAFEYISDYSVSLADYLLFNCLLIYKS